MPSWFLCSHESSLRMLIALRHDMLQLMNSNKLEDVVCLFSAVFAASCLVCWILTAASTGWWSLIVSLFLSCNILVRFCVSMNSHGLWLLGNFCDLQVNWGENFCYSAKPEIGARAGKFSRHLIVSGNCVSFWLFSACPFFFFLIAIRVILDEGTYSLLLGH